MPIKKWHLKLSLQRPNFEEFEPRLKFDMQLKYGWFHLKLYLLFQDLSRRSIEIGFWWIWDAGQIH